MSIVVITGLILKRNTAIDKIHYIVSTNGMDIERIKKTTVGEDSLLNKLKNNVDNIDLLLSSQLVKSVKENQDKK